MKLPNITNLCRRIAGKVTGYMERQRAMSHYRKSQRLKNRFYLEEIDGNIWIKLDDVAIYRFSEKQTQQDIIQRIDILRLTALCYDNKCNGHGSYK